MQQPRSSFSSSLRRVAIVGASAVLVAVSVSTIALHAGGLHAGGRFRQQPATPSPAPGPANPNPANPISLAELNRLFEAYAVVQAQEFLKLSDEQYPDFVARLKALQDARRRHFVNHNRIIADLGRTLRQPDDQIDEKTLRATYEALDREDETAQGEIKKAFDNVIALLDVKQRARFRVFEENLERRKLELLSRVQRPKRNVLNPPPATR